MRANTDGISLIACLHVFIWFSTTALGLCFGFPFAEDMPTDQGSLTPSDARLMVSMASTRKTVFLFICPEIK